MVKKVFKSIIIFLLTFEAWLVLRKYKPMIIAITGSVGKTTSKDAIADVLEKKYFVQRSKKSFNSEFGVPLTILGCESGWNNASTWFKILIEGILLIVLKNHYPKILVLEVGTDRPGDIPRITRWLKPDIAVITRFGDVPVHIEFFPSREALIEEKASLIQVLKEGKTAVLTIDDKDVKRLIQTIPEKKVISFGFAREAMVRALNKELLYDEKGRVKGVGCRIEYGDKVLPLRIMESVSIASIYSALAAFSVGVTLGMNMVEMLEILGKRSLPPGRGKLLEGVKGTTLIDDTYNSSPTALRASLEALGEIKTQGRKIAVLGDMLELGKYTADEHKKMGALAKVNADILVSVGHRAELAGEEAYRKKMLKKNIYHFASSEEAGEFLADFIQEGDVVLLKASQSIRMEKALVQLLADKENAEHLLVRQEKEWQER
ncbi:MAG: Mur ligase family protein [Candidatus Paceibacterota bacterium]